MPRVTIITVTFNAAATVEETLLSVFQQKFTDYEYWVVDGNSNDGTQEVVSQYTSRINFISEPDNGIYDAMNKGITKAKGEWIYFLNAGDTLYNDEVLSDIFNATIPKETELIYGNIRTKNHPSGSNYFQGSEVHLESFFYRVGLCHQATFTKLSAFEEIGVYAGAEYRILADQEWFVRFFLARKKAHYMNTTIAYYEIVGESYNKRVQSYEEHLKLVKKHFNYWVNFQNVIRSPWMKLKIKILQNFSNSPIYKLYRQFFFNN